jgi:hypothetical protein
MTLETPLGAMESRQCSGHAIELDADAISHRDGG